MIQPLIYSIGSSKSCMYATKHLESAGFSITDHPSPEVTHLLLDIPSQKSESTALTVLPSLPDAVTVIGGRFSDSFLAQHKCLDLLTDSFFLAQNAAITAECALRVAASRSERCWRGTKVLLLGWGRICQSLAQLLQSMQAECWIYSRSDIHLAQIGVLGYHPLHSIPGSLAPYHAVFNTAPALLIDENISSTATGILIDLASTKGMEGKNVICARGLPGLLAPQSAGELIAESIIRRIQEE